MQPIHSLENRWFWQWDKLEIIRGLGASIALAALMLFVLRYVYYMGFIMSYENIAEMFRIGGYLFLLAYVLDCLNGKVEGRAIACRVCGKKTTIGSVMGAGWKCRKCGAIARFDNRTRV
jgi:hypothetical protein